MRSPATSLTQCSGEPSSEILPAVQLHCNRLTSWLEGFLERLTIQPQTARRPGPRPEAGPRLEQVGTSLSPLPPPAPRLLQDLADLSPSPVDRFIARCRCYSGRGQGRH